ncbi:MAG: VOC family protein [Candidatus Micrarchaeaceae archaeon]|jgi:predicted enzyme related to lactoylglutathione lyase|nr:VOC family protein [Candidatus Micrarchaeota archaeon]HII10348.1 VOC family protein [Candidatus Micrarchaeota archaeon]
MPRVVHFEVFVDDPARASKFYKDIFGWKFEKYAPMDYWMVTTGDKKSPGINGGFARRDSKERTTVNTIDVKDIDATIKRVKAKGGKLVGKVNEIPNVGRMAYCRDTEGNQFGLIEMAQKPRSRR